MPKGWEWTRLEDFVYAVTDGDHLPPPKSPSGVPFLVISDVNTGRISFDKARYAEKDYYNSLPEIRKAVKGDILFTVTGSYGIVIPVETERQFCFQRHIGLIKTLTSSLWLTIALQSDYVLSYCDKVATGTAQKTVSLAHLRDLLIPIPPQRDQERINEELSKWLDAVNNISSNNERLSCAIDKTKSKILDLAIHGKLVPQDPNDEPAIELLKRINPKFTPCDNAHYENVPSTWTIILLGDLCFTINGLWKGKKPPFVNVGVIRNANFTKDCKLDYTNIAYLDVEVKQYEKRKLQCGDIIVEKSGGSDNQPVGRTILFERKDGDYSFSNFTSVLRIYDGYPALPAFLNMFLQSIYQTGVTKRMQTQTTGIHNLIFDQFLTIPVLLPPIAEQSRIIYKVNELFQLLDDISANL